MRQPPTTLEEARAWLECTCTTFGACEACQPQREAEFRRTFPADGEKEKDRE